MRISKIAALKLVCLISFLCAANSCAKVETAAGAWANRPWQKQHPRMSRRLPRVFRIRRKPAPGNRQGRAGAKTAGLSEGLRKSTRGASQTLRQSSRNPDYPSNSTFVGVWNKPTMHSVVGSRHYDYRDRDNPTITGGDRRALRGDTAGGPDNQYPGEKKSEVIRLRARNAACGS